MAEEQNDPLILVVDDNSEIRNMVVTHLESNPRCRVMQASDGEEGLAQILEHKPDLVLLDVMMPGLNGWEVAKYLRERDEFNNIGVIMVTAIGETVNEMTSPLYGADDHINKPFQLSELDFKIRRTLSRKRQQARQEQAESDAVAPPA